MRLQYVSVQKLHLKTLLMGPKLQLEIQFSREKNYYIIGMIVKWQGNGIIKTKLLNGRNKYN